MKSEATKKLKPEVLDVSMEELLSIVGRARVALSSAEHEMLMAAINTLGMLMEEVKKKGTSISRLQALLFGARTEKTRNIVGKNKKDAESPVESKDSQCGKVPGHGRMGAAAYTGAEIKIVSHSSLHSGECCPGCAQGKVYPLLDPAKLVRITGMSPLGATIWECERLRCNLCGEVFTAKAPKEVGDQKYDETATAMVGLLKYGAGLPFNRLEKLQAGMGIPLPATTQWEIVRKGACDLEPAFEELVRYAAQGEVLHNDDTTAKILELTGAQREAAAADSETENRTGVFTTGIVSICGSKRVALFFTGTKHAGENLEDLLSKRAIELSPPIQMCDALPANTAGNFETIVANCNSHARRRFVDVADNSPEECRYVLEIFSDLYKYDDETKTQRLSPLERLEYHQTHSGPRIEQLKVWMQQQLDEHVVEPNSGLGDAIKYLNKHWQKLTLFLRVAGAPLDNNICERAIKKVIQHRKNSLFFKTRNGARVGDIFMSLIHTAELSKINPFDYLVTLLRKHTEVARSPENWMPWNYQQTLASLDSQAPPDG